MFLLVHVNVQQMRRPSKQTNKVDTHLIDLVSDEMAEAVDSVHVAHLNFK